MGAVAKKDQIYWLGPTPVGVRAMVTELEDGVVLEVTALVKGVQGGSGEYVYRGQFPTDEAARYFASQWVGSSEDWEFGFDRFVDSYMSLGDLPG